MKQYIGTKLIEAGPCPAWKDADGHKTGDSGYKVRYPGGYESWSPKDVFERAYLPLSVNTNLRTHAPSISQEMVDGFIAETFTETMGDKCTVVRAVLRNGFEIVESSACVSAENYDEKLGEKICLGKIKDKVWMLLGFLLQTAVRGVAKDEFEEAYRPVSGMSFGLAIEAAKRGMRIKRRGWNGKDQYVELAAGISYRNAAGEIINVDHQTIGNRALAFVGTSGVQLGWLASQADMLAEDWEIVQNAEGVDINNGNG